MLSGQRRTSYLFARGRSVVTTNQVSRSIVLPRIYHHHIIYNMLQTNSWLMYDAPFLSLLLLFFTPRISLQQR